MFGTNIRAIIPQMAMSAGTMIALSTREIIMGKHSNLGPIDPQIAGIPAHGVIEEFNRAAGASAGICWNRMTSVSNAKQEFCPASCYPGVDAAADKAPPQPDEHEAEPVESTP
jgi:membrane-bound ClpP family serine protease